MALSVQIHTHCTVVSSALHTKLCSVLVKDHSLQCKSLGMQWSHKCTFLPYASKGLRVIHVLRLQYLLGRFSDIEHYTYWYL